MSNTHQGILSTDKTDILEIQFDIPNKGVKSLNGFTLRDIYEALLLSKLVEIRSKEYWSKKYMIWILIGKNGFHTIFWNILIPRKCNDLNWKIFHGQMNTELHLKEI